MVCLYIPLAVMKFIFEIGEVYEYFTLFMLTLAAPLGGLGIE